MRVKSTTLMVVGVLLMLSAACNRHEHSITGSYGNAVLTGQVTMAAGVANGSPAGVVVSVAGTGMSATLGDDGRFTFVDVPDNARLRFSRAADGIDASMSVAARGGAVAVELSATTAAAGASGRRRAASSKPMLQFEGVVTTAAADSLQITDSHRQDVTLTLTADTVIRKGQTQLTPADLVAGDRVHVMATVKDDVKTAVLVIVQNESEDEQEPGGETQTATANGIVSALGTDELTVLRANGETVTVKVTSTTTIRKYGVAITFADIKAGDKVESLGTRVDDHTITATKIEVQNAPGSGGKGPK